MKYYCGEINEYKSFLVHVSIFLIAVVEAFEASNENSDLFFNSEIKKNEKCS